MLRAKIIAIIRNLCLDRIVIAPLLTDRNIIPIYKNNPEINGWRLIISKKLAKKKEKPIAKSIQSRTVFFIMADN